ncbi:uncharacterized protein IAS62_002265 [Cryptococcus decagattii]|uniref:Uncharacterized protein n=1 Tax=Cryptococcus decagattii TaxID=1859122 RepID=A0ABZ2AR64_9TREE
MDYEPDMMDGIEKRSAGESRSLNGRERDFNEMQSKGENRVSAAAERVYISFKHVARIWPAKLSLYSILILPSHTSLSILFSTFPNVASPLALPTFPTGAISLLIFHAVYKPTPRKAHEHQTLHFAVTSGLILDVIVSG